MVTDKAIASMSHSIQNCSLTITSQPQSKDKVLLKFSIKNAFNKNMKLLIWYTPFEGFLSDLFEIKKTDTDERVKYQGAMVKRLNPQPEDYLPISANEISSVEMNLSLAYAFTKGSYQLKMKSQTFYFQDDNSNRFPVFCKASTVNLDIL